ncbi:MAG: Na+/H+ antiporter subunit E [Magnetococcus sp. WYHC-3]
MVRLREKWSQWVVLYLIWLMLNQSLAPDVLMVGAVAALLIVLLLGGMLSPLSGLRLTPRGLTATLRFLLYFLQELVKANLKLAAIVISPKLPINPGIVRVRTRLKSPMGRLLLANSITLTPGTLTVEVVDEWLYIHCVTVEATDLETATAQIVAGFETHLEVMYG